jgi:Cys-tRNA(Pro) deacylase
MNAEASTITPVTLVLDRQEIPYRFFTHPGQIQSLEQAAKERGQHPDQVIRSILFRLSQEDFFMVLVAGPRQISWKKLRKQLNQSRLSMASEEEVKRVTGYPLGAVSPLGLENAIRLIVDESVLDQEEISIGSGVRNTSIIMKTKDLIRGLGDFEIVDLLDRK